MGELYSTTRKNNNEQILPCNGPPTTTSKEKQLQVILRTFTRSVTISNWRPPSPCPKVELCI